VGVWVLDSVWFSLCESFAPIELANLQANERLETVRKATDFVVGQMSALPLVLRFCLNLGLAFFRLSALLLTLRPFEANNLEARRRLTLTWAYGSFGLARRLFAPIRTLAIFAYYDNPIVLDCIGGQDAQSKLFESTSIIRKINP
jgi:hypothetical protein